MNRGRITPQPSVKGSLTNGNAPFVPVTNTPAVQAPLLVAAAGWLSPSTFDDA